MQGIPPSPVGPSASVSRFYRSVFLLLLFLSLLLFLLLLPPLLLLKELVEDLVISNAHPQDPNPLGAASPLLTRVYVSQEPLDKVSAKLPWNKNREELQKMKTQKKVLDGLTPLQRRKPDTIRHGHRQAIAARAGVVSA